MSLEDFANDATIKRLEQAIRGLAYTFDSTMDEMRDRIATLEGQVSDLRNGLNGHSHGTDPNYYETDRFWL